MKTLRYFSFFLFALVLGAGVASCSDDESIDSSALVGRWEAIWIEGHEYYFDNPEYNEEWNEACSGDIIELKSDGTGYSADNDVFHWKLEGNKLKVSFGGEYYGDMATVLKVTSSELVLEYYEKDEEYEYYEKMTCKKIG